MRSYSATELLENHHCRTLVRIAARSVSVVLFSSNRPCHLSELTVRGFRLLFVIITRHSFTTFSEMEVCLQISEQACSSGYVALIVLDK